MGKNDQLAECAKLAEGEGRKVENGGVVMFGQDEAAAQVFAYKERKAGLQVLVGPTRGNSNEPDEWGVNLL